MIENIVFFRTTNVHLAPNENEQQIEVKILRARNLVAKDANGYSDPNENNHVIKLTHANHY